MKCLKFIASIACKHQKGPLLAYCIYNMTRHKRFLSQKKYWSQASGWPASFTCNFSRSAAGSTSWRNPSVDGPQVDYEIVSHVELMKFQEWSLQFNFEKIIAWIPRDLTEVKCLNYPPEVFRGVIPKGKGHVLNWVVRVLFQHAIPKQILYEMPLGFEDVIHSRWASWKAKPSTRYVLDSWLTFADTVYEMKFVMVELGYSQFHPQ